MLTRRGFVPAAVSVLASGTLATQTQASEVSDLIEIPTEELLALRQQATTNGVSLNEFVLSALRQKLSTS